MKYKQKELTFKVVLQSKKVGGNVSIDFHLVRKCTQEPGMRVGEWGYWTSEKASAIAAEIERILTQDAETFIKE